MCTALEIKLNQRMLGKQSSGPYIVTEVWNNVIVCACKGNITDTYKLAQHHPFQRIGMTSIMGRMS